MPIKDLNRSDLWFTMDGDFLIDGAGDLRDTLDSGDRTEGLRQAILHRLVGEQGAFRLHPTVTAGLESFVGKNVDKNTLEGIQFVIHRALSFDGALTRNDYKIRVFEITPGDVVILIFVNLPYQEHPIVSMVYNIQYGEITRVQ